MVPACKEIVRVKLVAHSAKKKMKPFSSFNNTVWREIEGISSNALDQVISRNQGASVGVSIRLVGNIGEQSALNCLHSFGTFREAMFMDEILFALRLTSKRKQGVFSYRSLMSVQVGLSWIHLKGSTTDCVPTTAIKNTIKALCSEGYAKKMKSRQKYTFYVVKIHTCLRSNA